MPATEPVQKDRGRYPINRELPAFAAVWLLSVAGVLGAEWAAIRRYSPGATALSILIAAFALQFALFWLPGFSGIRRSMEERAGRWFPIAAGAALIAPYLVYAAGTGAWSLAGLSKLVALAAVTLGIYSLFPARRDRITWQDVTVMAVLALPLYSGWYRDVWSYPVYLDAMARLFAVALGAFAVLSVRRLSNVGYEWRLSWGDWAAGLKQLLLYSLVGIPLGFLLGFIAWHPRQIGVAILLSFVGIFLLIAVPEELFFRGILQNVLEKSMANRYAARAVASVVFGLSHIHHGFPNWRYVIMASVAGWFYGTAWHDRRSIVAASVTHAAVDTLWHHFLRL